MMRSVIPWTQKVTVGGGSGMTSTHKGDLTLRSKRNPKIIIVLIGVLCIPAFGKNVINVKILAKKGCTFTIGEDCAFLMDAKGNKIIFEENSKDELYYFHAIKVAMEPKNCNNIMSKVPQVSDDEDSDEDPDKPPPKPTKLKNNKTKLTSTLQKKSSESGEDESKTLVGNGEDPSKTKDGQQPAESTTKFLTTMEINEAHCKYAHASETLLRRTLKHYQVKSTGTFETCDGCLRTKAKAKKLLKINSNKAEKPGERLLMDTSGPFHETTAGSKYWIKIMDEKTKKCWDYFAKKKSEVPTKAESLIILLNNIGYTVKFLRCDDAGEHGPKLVKVCEQHGITLEYTGRNTPQRNGIVERRFQTDGERATAALISAGIPPYIRNYIWAEVSKSASELNNITMNSTTELPPDTMFYGKDSKLPTHLIELGRIGYIAKSAKIKGKKYIVDKSIPMLMCGYAPNHARDTYRMFNPKTLKLTQSRNVQWSTFKRSQASDLLKEYRTEADEVESSDDETEIIKTAPVESGYFQDTSEDSDDSDESATTVDIPDAAAERMDEEEEDSSTAPSENDDNDVDADEDNIQDDDDENEEKDPPQVHREMAKLKTSYNDGTLDVDMNSKTRTRSQSRTVSFAFSTQLTSDPKTPTTYKEATTGPETKSWIEAIKGEFNNFLSRDAWIMTSRKSIGKRKALGTKHVFKLKLEQDGSTRYKNRVVVKGFMSIPGVDYTESFAPVATETTIRLVITIGLYNEWTIELVDYEAAFLNADMKVDMYIEYPEGMVELGFITKEQARDNVAKLGRSMYGAVDASLRWNVTLMKHLTGPMKLKQSLADPCCVYRRRNGETTLIFAITVDDTILTGRDEDVKWFKETIKKTFNTTNLGKLRKHLGVSYEWGKTDKGHKYILANMKLYEKEMVEDFEKFLGNKLKTAETPGWPGKTLLKHVGEPVNHKEYRSFVGRLMHWVKKLAPETSNSIRELAQHLQNPGDEHWKSLTRFMGYVKSGKYKTLRYNKPKEMRQVCYADSNYAQNSDDRKSVSCVHNTIDGRCMTYNSSQNQKVIALSSCDSEYYGYSKACQEIKFTQQLCDEVCGEGFLKKPAILYGDNQGAIFLVKNKQVGQRTKHIDIRHHFMRAMQEDGEVSFRFRGTERMVADVGTKNTPVKTFDGHSFKMRNGCVDR